MKNLAKKGMWTLLALLISLSAALSGCAAASKNIGLSSARDSAPATESVYEYDYKYDYEAKGSESYYRSEDISGTAAAGEGNGAGAVSDSPESEQKIIKNADVDMKAQDVTAAYQEILAYAKENGGYEFSQSANTSGDYTTLEAKVKIPADKLDGLISFIDGCGEVVNRNITSTDITDRYYDTEIRLKTKKASLEQYYKMLGEAKNVDEIIRLQSTIDSMTEDIEALEGKLKLWQKLVAESTLTLYIQQKDDPAAISRDIKWNALSLSDMGWIIAGGFVKVANGLVSVVQWILIAVVVISPVLIIGGIVFFITLLIRRKKKNSGDK